MLLISHLKMEKHSSNLSVILSINDEVGHLHISNLSMALVKSSGSSSVPYASYISSIMDVMDNILVRIRLTPGNGAKNLFTQNCV